MKEPEYSSWTIKKLNEAIESKTIIIPTLQRDQVWTDKDIQKLQDSVVKGYPIGTLIFNKVKENNGKEIYYLLDGLQRTSSLIKIIKNKYKNLSKDHVEKIVKDLKNNSRHKGINVKSNDIHKIMVENCDAFVENKTLTSKAEFLKKEIIFKNELRDPKETNLSFVFEFIEKLEDSLPKENYKVPFIEYENENDDLDSISEIFELLNTQGTPLTELEILAASWNNLSLNINETEFGKMFLRIVKDRYVSLEELGLKRQDDNIKKSKVSPFEFIYGIAKIIGKETEWNQLNTLFIANDKVINLNIMLLLLKWFLFHFQENNASKIKNIEVGKKIVKVFDNKTSDIDGFINFIVQVSNEIMEKFPIFSFKSNAKDNSKSISFGAANIVWFLIYYIKNNYNNDFSIKDVPLKSNNKIMMEFIYKIIDETFASGSVKKVYRYVIKDVDTSTQMLIEIIKAKNSQLLTDTRRMSFPHWVKVLMSYIYIKESKDYTYEIWHIRKFEEDHLIPKAILNNLCAQSALCNYSLIINKQNLEKSNNVDVKYLESDFVYKISNEASQHQQRKLYLSFQNEPTKENYLSFLEVRLPVIIALIEKHFK